MVAAAAWAQPLTVYSDLADIDATGKVIAPETPREILSPALLRNGFTSFQVVVQAPADRKWWLFIGQNPADSVKVTMYRESAGKLEPVEVPLQSSGTEVLWMDVWTGRNAPIARIKIEPELMIDDDWVIYPIEARVMEAVAPEMPPFTLAASAPAAIRLSVKLDRDCGVIFANPVGNDGPSVARWRFRNIEQDIRLADEHAVLDELRKRNNACDLVQPKDPEHFLRIRDYLYRLR